DDMMRFGVIDQIVTEPPGGAHRDPAAAIASTGEAIANALEELAGLDRETVRRQRREKFLAIGRTWGRAPRLRRIFPRQWLVNVCFPSESAKVRFSIFALISPKS